MASASRNERRKRQVKRTNTLLKHTLKGFQKAYELAEAQKQNVILMMAAVLAQRGGEITITQGTLNQVLANVTTLGFSMNPSEVPGEFLIKLVTQEVDDASTADDVTAGSDGEFTDSLISPAANADTSSEPESVQQPVSIILTD